MDRSEPALVPQWLKGPNGGINGGGSSLHHIASVLQSDDHFTSNNSTRNELFVSSNDNETSRTSDRKSSHFRRSSSSNGSILHDKGSLHSRSYSSFSRSHRERDKDRVPLRGQRDFSDSLMPSTDALMSKTERDVLRRSLSTISGKRGEVWSKGSVNNLNSKPHAAGSTHASHSNKSAFERDFPSLGLEDKSGVTEVGRVKSPGLTSPSQSLPMNSSTVIGGDGWTSVLAEVPVIIGGSSSVILPAPVSAPSSLVNMPLSSNTGLNMAEALVQAPARARTPQLSVDTQRLEELAIKQSRQLIPVTPSMPKNGVLSSVDKSKSKALRTTELSSASKTGQQALSSSHLVNNSLRGSSKPDSLKTSQSNSNFVILNREKNGFPASVGSETSSPTHASKLPLSVTPPAATAAPLRSPTNVKLKTAPATCGQSAASDKKLTSQAQNRNDFFNSLRKKTSANNNHISAVQDSAVSSASSEKPEEQIVENPSAHVDNGKDAGPSSGSVLDCSLSDSGSTAIASIGGEIFCSDEHDVFGSDAIAYPDEEEEKFLKSLGWRADAQEEALTEKEIQEFIEYNKDKLASKLCHQLNGVSSTPQVESLACSSASDPDA